MSAAECKQLQKDEIEALSSIFGDKYHELTSKHPKSYELTIEPSTDESQNMAVLLLRVKYNKEYPLSTVPELVVSKVRGGIAKADIVALQAVAESAAEALKGEVCVFEVCERLREWLVDHNEPERSMHEEMLLRANAAAAGAAGPQPDKAGGAGAAAAGAVGAGAAAAGARAGPSYVSKIPAGTLVTPESFAKWKADFDREKAAKRAQSMLDSERLAAEERKKKPTGREIFERNVQLGLSEADEAGALPDEDEQIFYFNETLFAEGDVDDADEDDEEEKDDADGREAEQPQ